MRVCVDARLGTGRSGGVEQVVIGLAAGLSALSDGDEEFLFLTHEGNDDWIRPYLSGPCRVIHTRRSRPSRVARAASRAALERLPGLGPRFAVRRSDGTIERSGADVVHFPFQDALLTSVPSLYQPHDLQHLHLPELFSPWQRARRERIYRAHCEAAATIVSMTSWGRQDLIDHYRLAPEKVAVVPGGSVLSDYPEPSADDLVALGRRLSLPSEFVFYPAATWPHKNHMRLLDAIAEIKRRHGVTVPLVLSGAQTGDFEGIEAHARGLGLEATTRFAGFVSPGELRGLYELARGLVFPSRFEGWGLPICEAWSAGVPVASSSATSLPDLIGDSGLLFDPDDTDQIAAAILRLWSEEELRETLAERGRERSRLFGFDRTARLFRAHDRRIGQRPLSEEDRILLESPPPA
jgi:glycosyltransferase involved in cell wall biosynthesis